MAAITYPFSLTPDVALYDLEMPSTVHRIHTYCLKRLNIPGWIIRPADIAKQFKCSIKTAFRALWWFRDHGYGTKTNDGRWIIYPTPQIPQAPYNKAIEPLEAWTKMSILEPVLVDKNVQLIDKEAFKEKEQQHQPEPITEKPVVVFSGEGLPGKDQEPMPDGDPLEPEPIPLHDPEPIPEQEPLHDPEPIPTPEPVKEPVMLEYPPQLTTGQLKNAKNSIKKCKDVALQPEVLFAFAYYLSRGGVKNPCAYLAGLVRDANNGTFVPIQTAGATKPNKPRESYWQGHKPPEKVNNASFFADLQKRFGSKATAAIPAALRGANHE